MKLRNKKTGEILELCCHRSGDYREKYDSLAELNEEWEDVPEEPKKYYYITSCGETTHRGYRLWENESIYDKNRKQIGNYFETEEEAEQAVEKLKAWKRLRDAGFKFEKWEKEYGPRIVLIGTIADENAPAYGIMKDLEIIMKEKEVE